MCDKLTIYTQHYQNLVHDFFEKIKHIIKNVSYDGIIDFKHNTQISCIRK